MKTRVSEMLGIRYPIVCGGMMRVGRAKLAAAVSNAGGLGIMTALSLPTPDEVIKEVELARNMTDQPLAVNLTILPTITPVPYEEYAKAIVASGVKIVETAGNNPQRVMPIFKEAGIKVIHTCTSIQHAKKDETLGCDIISVDGFECAGHVGEDDDINGTVNLFARDNVPLYLKWLLGDAALGYFSLAARLITLVTLPIDPFITPTYTEITRTVAQRQWQTTRKLLKQVSLIGGAWTLLAGGGILALGWWLIPPVFGPDALPAYPCFIILLIGYGVANLANWNRPLLPALGYPNYPLIVAAVAGTIEIALIFLLVPSGGILVGAAIFSAYLVVTILVNVARGLSILNYNKAHA